MGVRHLYREGLPLAIQFETGRYESGYAWREDKK